MLSTVLERHRAFLPSLVLIVAVLTASWPSNAAGDEPLRPEKKSRLAPCCANGEADLGVAAKAGKAGKANDETAPVVQRREMPDHALHDPETLKRAKDAALLEPIVRGEDAPKPLALLDGDATDRAFAEKRGASPQAAIPPKALRLVSQFEGLNTVQAQHQGVFGFPPDTIVAAGPTRVIEATNVALRLSNRDGGTLETRSLNNFFSAPFPPILFDPKVYYDRLSGRFFLVSISLDLQEKRSFIYLSVSRSPSPSTLAAPRDWCTYRLPGRVGQSWADFPGLGMNEKWLGLTTNNFNFTGGFRSVFLYALDKRRLVANGASCPSTDFFRFRAGQDGDGDVAFTVQPALHYTPSGLPGSPLFLVSSKSELAVLQGYGLWRLRDDPAGGAEPVLVRETFAGNDFYSTPPNAPQRRGTQLDTGDPRIQHAVFRDGTLWAVHTTGCNFGPAPGESCARAIAVTPRASGADVVFEETFGVGHGWYVWMPAIAVNARGDVAVAFQRSHDTMSTGVGFTGKLAGAPTFDGVRKLVNGRCGLDNFDGQRNRTGDYVGAQTDPVDDISFWIAGEYTGTVGRLGCDWRTRVARIAF